MTNLRKILCVCVMAAVLVMTFPVSSLAVDPVSATVMANAFAQAVTAYGAQQGVSMMFDVTDTSQIGETIHELWKQFKQSDNLADNFNSLAAAIFPRLYNKVVLGTSAFVNIKLLAEDMPEIDGFWNWLLSGPAEMQKIDDQYFEWVISSGGNVNPILVYSDEFVELPLLNASSSDEYLYNNSASLFTVVHSSNLVDNRRAFSYLANVDPVYCFAIPFDGQNVNITFCSYSYQSIYNTYYFNDYSKSSFSLNSNPFEYDSSSVYYHTAIYGNFANGSVTFDVPVFDTYEDGLISFITNSYASSVSVAPYVGEAAPQDVYIPDNEDVNYQPMEQNIPIDVTWDYNIFGDGTQTLTDEQSIAIANSLSSEIAGSDTLTLANEGEIINPGEVYIPLLPVELPSFNFSLSGIWHYVVSWVGSLGSWFTTVFSVWSVLPYAMVVPVYATAVVVIVLGVYKRFFM